MIIRGTSIVSSNVITNVFTDSRKMILKSDSFILNLLNSKKLVIASQTEQFLSCDRNVRASSENEDSRIDYCRIGTPFVKKKIQSGDDNFSVLSDVGKANKLDTSVQKFSTNERNTASSRIKKENLKNVFSKTVEQSNSCKRMNLVNSAIIEPPRIISFGHPPMETDNLGYRLNDVLVTRIEDTHRDDSMVHRHDDIETISKKYI